MPTYTMKPIEKVTLSAAQSSVTFSNIPSDYTDLFIRCSVRSSSTTGSSNLFVYFNGVNGTSYRMLQSLGDGNGSPYRVANTNYPWVELSPAIPNANGNFTANSFANAEIWIQDYRKTSVKTAINGFIASESNIASVYTGTTHADFNNAGSPITSVTIDGTDNFVAGSTFVLYGVSSASKIAASSASGGDVIGTDGTYWYHAFLSTGSFVPTRALSADILLVAGGGGASGGLSGGGGAGGVLLLSSQSLSATSYTVTVGGGGSGGGNASTAGTNGVNSTFGAFTSAVGGGRGGYDYTYGGNGGSGGGASWLSSTGGTPTSTQGHYGAYGNYDGYSGGGGGGAGGPGITAGTYTRGGDGGIGTASYTNWGIITGTGVVSSNLRYYAGGGGGGASNSSIGSKYWDGGPGGTGGGGSGGGNNGAPSSGTSNTGGGGGGGGGNSPVYGGAGGGSGIVIVRYPI